MRLAGTCLFSLLLLTSCNKGSVEVEPAKTSTTPKWSWKTTSQTQLNLTGDLVTVAGYDSVYGAHDDIGSYATFDTLNGITYDGSFIYVTDISNNSIRKINIQTAEVTTVAGHSGESVSVDGIGPAAKFGGPWAITTDGKFLYVTDQFTHTIRKVEIATNRVTTIAGSPNVVGNADGIGPSARFDHPSGIVTDGEVLYIGDYNNSTIRKLDLSTNMVTTFAGATGDSGTSDGPAALARFRNPDGLTMDENHLYVADSAGNTIRRIELKTGYVRTIAGDPLASSGHVNGRGRAARFQNPWALTNDSTYIYVAENSCTIRKVHKQTWDVSTVTGVHSSCSSVDGPKDTARLQTVYGMTAVNNNLYFFGYGTIRRVD